GSVQQMPDQLARARVISQQFQRRTPVEVPDLVRLDHVPTTDLVPLEQVVDGGQGGAPPLGGLHLKSRAMDLPVPPSFRVGLQGQQPDDVSSLHSLVSSWRE